MQWNKKLVQLNDALAFIIPFPNNALTFLQRAKIDFTQIEFSGGAMTMWNNILHFVVNNNQVMTLVDAILETYPQNPYLLAFKEEKLQDYNPGPDIRTIEWQNRLDNETKEKIMGSESTLLPIKFLEEGLHVARCVVRIKVKHDDKNELGSGFLIDNNILITNHHVIQDERTAALAEIAFDYQEALSGRVLEAKFYKLDPVSFFKTSAEDDWTAVKIDGDANSIYGKLNLKTATAKMGDFVNIIQHPGGRYKQIALYHNIVTYADENIVQYLTDTEPGSSGSPVFNSRWEVVALHHSGGALQEPGVEQKMLRNEGISIGKIIKGLNINTATKG